MVHFIEDNTNSFVRQGNNWKKKTFYIQSAFLNRYSSYLCIFFTTWHVNFFWVQTGCNFEMLKSCSFYIVVSWKYGLYCLLNPLQTDRILLKQLSKMYLLCNRVGKTSQEKWCSDESWMSACASGNCSKCLLWLRQINLKLKLLWDYVLQ